MAYSTVTTRVEQTRSPLLYWSAVISVALGTFSIVTTEMLPVGMLTMIGPDLGISNGLSGQAMTVTSVTAFLAAPAVLIAAGRLDRRLVLGLMMAVLLAANLITVFSADLMLLLVARIMVGCSIGGFWAIGVSLAARLVPQQAVPRAASVIMSGVAIASVAGVPAGTFIGEHAGWRAAFGAMAVLSLLVLAAVLVLLPPLPSATRLRLGDLVAQLRHPPMRLGIIALTLAVVGHFVAYTYVTPVLRDTVGISPGVVATVLLIYGAAGVVGNFAAGALAGNRVRKLIIGAMALMAAATALLPLAGRGLVPAVILLVVWGLAYGAVPVCFQVWTVREAPNVEAGSALLASVFQLAIAVGAILGGLAVDMLDINAPMWIGAVTSVACVLLVATARPAGRN